MEWTIDAIWKKDMVPCYNRDGEVARVALGVGRSGERGEVTLHMPETNSIVIHDHTTRARTIIISTYELVFEDSMLSNDIIDYIILKNFRDDHECLGTSKDQEESKKVAQAKIDAQFNLDSTTLATRSSVH
jgi:hypothetical protein